MACWVKQVSSKYSAPACKEVGKFPNHHKTYQTSHKRPTGSIHSSPVTSVHRDTTQEEA